MLTITESIPSFDTYEKSLGYHSETCLFFDIETTGLSSGSAAVFLIGVVYRTDGTDSAWQLTQWIAQGPEDEPAVLQSFLTAAENYDTLIHFNGATFDLPFLKGRAKKYQLAENLSEKESLDLYQKFRPLKKILGLERMNQAMLEQFLGWPRRDRLTGKQMLSLFFKYAASQEQGLCELLLLHNHDDLLGMTALLRLSAYTMLFSGDTGTIFASVIKADPSDVQSLAEDVLKPADLTVRTKPTEDVPHSADRFRDSGVLNTQKFLLLQIHLRAELPQSISLTRNLWPEPHPQHTKEQNAPGSLNSEIRLYAAGAEAVLIIPGFCGEMRHFLHDYRNYYYLPLEDQAIHKSVAAFVDREYRMPATPSNCCIKKSGLFFPQMEEYFPPAFKPSFASRELYFSCEEPESLQRADPEQLNAYAASLLHLFLK